MLRQIAPVPPPALADDHKTVMALQNIPTFQYINPIHNPAELLRIQTVLIHEEQEEQMAEQALMQIRARRATTSHTYHDAVVGARTQVLAQYGPDSNEVALIGLTRKSERKRPTRRKTLTK
ncbi:MAG: hypothetical protein WCF99_17715 [Chloroflexales bacterium]